ASRRAGSPSPDQDYFAALHLYFHPRPESLQGGRDPVADRALGDAERGRDLAVAVALVVAQHERRRLLRWQAPQLGHDGPLFRPSGGIASRRRRAEPPQERR